MFINDKNGSYSVNCLLRDHTCEIKMSCNGQHGGWDLEAIPDPIKHPEMESKVFKGRDIEDVMTKAAKFFLKNS